ncbi:MAG: general secretion pathway protein GspB [Deltaproteobacteria bacterium]|jgi:hypothetical protein|nr:general secretion pathway protein GspB [Deltaproteobacteria bacterium]
MSTILNALKQAEKESPDQKDKNHTSFNVRTTLNSRMQHQKPDTFLSLGRVVFLFALVIVLILFSYDFFLNNKNNYHQMSYTDKQSQVLGTLPDIVKDQKQILTESVIQPSELPDISNKTIPKPATKSFDRSRPENETVLKPEPVNRIQAAKKLYNKEKRQITMPSDTDPAVNHSEKENLIKDEKILTNKATTKQKILPLKNHILKIQAISWAEEPANRIAVIDNRVLTEGDSVQGYRLVGIEKDSVILHYSDNDYRLKFNHQ